MIDRRPCPMCGKFMAHVHQTGGWLCPIKVGGCGYSENPGRVEPRELAAHGGQAPASGARTDAGRSGMSSPDTTAVGEKRDTGQSHDLPESASAGTVHRIALVLPLPPSTENTRSTHPIEDGKRKNRYRRKCWAEAIQQVRPLVYPPAHVTLRPIFRGHNRRDEDNAAASLKWVLDTLKQKQRGRLAWRSSAWEERGYFVDDDPKHLTVEKPVQVIDRRHPGLILELIWET